MQDLRLPIRPPHACLADSNHKAHDPVVLFSGPLKGQWDKERVRAALQRQGSPPENAEAIADNMPDEIDGVGKISFELVPEPHIKRLFSSLEWHPSSVWPDLVAPERPSARCATIAGNAHLPDPVLPPSASIGLNRIMSSVQVGDPHEKLDEVRFYLVNFQVHTLTEDLQRPSAPGLFGNRNAGLSLSGDTWQISIDRRPDYSAALTHLEESRGFAITHNCRLWRQNDNGSSQFTFVDAEVVLEAIELFTSFLRGGMVGVALPVGYRDGSVVFEQWHVTTADKGRYPDPGRRWPLEGWYVFWDGLLDPNLEPATHLPDMFVRFAKAWWDLDQGLQRVWRTVFRQVIYSYTDAERVGERRGIVPACTALETLAWAILVVKESWLKGEVPGERKKGGYERLTAADRLRLVLCWAGIPTDVATTLPSIAKKATRERMDGPEIVIWARNRAVHPDKNDQLTDELAAESWATAMQYTELVVLRLLGYQGHYRDRLNNGEVKPVPWRVG